MAGKYDIRRIPSVLPGFVPAPTAGTPAGYHGGGNQGGAEGDGYIGRMGRPWAPARARGYAFQCARCGLGHKESEDARTCCMTPKEKEDEQ